MALWGVEAVLRQLIMAHRVRVDIVREKNGPVSVKTVLVRDPGPGEALFNGGPGATGRSYSGYPTILASIRERLLTLPDEWFAPATATTPPSAPNGKHWPHSPSNNAPANRERTVTTDVAIG